MPSTPWPTPSLSFASLASSKVYSLPPKNWRHFHCLLLNAVCQAKSHPQSLPCSSCITPGYMSQYCFRICDTYLCCTERALQGETHQRTLNGTMAHMTPLWYLMPQQPQQWPKPSTSQVFLHLRDEKWTWVFLSKREQKQVLSIPVDAGVSTRGCIHKKTMLA